jgi:hypothetical protein
VMVVDRPGLLACDQTTRDVSYPRSDTVFHVYPHP